MNAIGKDYLAAIESFERVNKPLCDLDPWRLKFHIMPPVGWLNDPNGLAYFKGKYHVYFQYSPFNPEGGMKCWGHYTSADMVSWNYEGAALLPDEAFDVHGVYSGSALTEDDYMYLYYTGNVKKKGDYDYINDGREANTICVRTKDGNHFEEKKLIMENAAYGDDLTCHVRDPKVWKQDGHYYMAQGARDRDHKGKILIFQSEDKWNWEYKHTLESETAFGYMWECPDLFLLDGVWFLCFSPQGVEEKGYEFQNIYQSGYSVIEGDPLAGGVPGAFRELDRGFDYYAPQSFLAPDGRRIQIGWMGLPDIGGIYENPTVAHGWQHAMTVPRQLTVRNGRLCQNPVDELKSLRGKEEVLCVNGEETKSMGTCFEMELVMRNGSDPIRIRLAGGLVMEFIPVERRFDMTFISEIGGGRTKRSVRLENLRDIRILADTSSLELFLNGGEEVFTTRFYPVGEVREAVITAKGAEGFLWNYNSFR